jgi:thiamine pyrophosphate-dependent acetolactate synthase large subunit-like protein
LAPGSRLPSDRSIAVVGDGAYLFSNPAAVHHAAALHDLPVLFIVMNNAMWNAVRHFTSAMYPGGRASKRNESPFMRLDRLPAFEQICIAAGGYGERVEDPCRIARRPRARHCRCDARKAPGASQRDLQRRVSFCL